MNLFSTPFFRVDTLSKFVAGFICLFSVLVIIYSIGYMRQQRKKFLYYLYLVLTAVASVAVVFSNNLVIFMLFWGILGALLYLLIGYGKTKRTSFTAKKTFIIIGGTDAFMLLGLALIWKLSGTFQMDKISIALHSKHAIAAYLCLLAGAFAKAGMMPFHTWVPDTAEDAPVPVTAFLPASLDKLLGIYFLFRLSLDLFIMTPRMNTLLMAMGSITIVAAVMMALVQHDLKRLLGYHAVSQVGYMVLGIGTGNPVGIAGGLFHMLNNAIYKSSLFLSGGAVEKKTGTSDLDKLGGVSKIMPITFIAFLVASLAISGVPPFNGFASKWMIYQGIIQAGKGTNGLWIIWLVAAMFGSALTLASFMKLIHAVFLGQISKEARDVVVPGQINENAFMWMPNVILAVLCVVFGILAFRIPLNMFIFPSIGVPVAFQGIWQSGFATLLTIVGLAIGLVIYLLGNIAKTRTVEPFIGGETLASNPEMRLSGTQFYNTIQEIGLLKAMYKSAENKAFDIYEVGTKFTFGFNKLLRAMHNGILSSYLAWCLLGMLILFYIILR